MLPSDLSHGSQNTLSQTLKTGPALLVLFAPPAARARLGQLATLEARVDGAGLRIIAVAMAEATGKSLARSASAPSIVVKVSDDVRTTLALFRSPKDGGETELMLDRNARFRARWTTSGAGGLADTATLVSDALRVATIPVATANHAGHAH